MREANRVQKQRRTSRMDIIILSRRNERLKMGDLFSPFKGMSGVEGEYVASRGYLTSVRVWKKRAVLCSR